MTPLLPLPLTGQVMLVTPAGGGLPELEIKFGAPIPLDLHATVALAGGRMTSTIDGLPDVPLTSFALTLFGGDRGLLAAQQDLCPPGQQTLGGQFAAHSGASVAATGPITVTGCPQPRRTRRPLPSASATLHGRGRHAVLTIVARAARGGPPLRALRVRLPHGIRLRRATLTVSAHGHRVRVRHSTATLAVRRLPGAGAAVVVVRIPGDALRLGRRVGRRLIVTVVDAHGQRLTFAVRLRRR